MSKSKNSGRIRMLSIWENSFSQFISHKPNKHHHYPEGDWSCIIMVPKVCCRFSISEFKSSKDLEIVLTPFSKGFPYIQNILLSPCRSHETTVIWAFMSPGLICASLNGHTCHPLKEPRKLSAWRLSEKLFVTLFQEGFSESAACSPSAFPIAPWPSPALIFVVKSGARAQRWRCYLPDPWS